MKRVLLLLLLLPVKTFAQDWIDYTYNSAVIMSLPSSYHERHLDGMPSTTATVRGGVIVITHVADSPTNGTRVRDTSDLTRAYKLLRDEVISARQGTLVTSNITEKDGIKWNSYVDHALVNGADQDIYSQSVHVNGVMYILTFLNMGPPTMEKDEARKRFFASVRIADGVSKNQVSVKVPSSSSDGSRASLLTFMTSIAAFVVLLIGYRKWRIPTQSSTQEGSGGRSVAAFIESGKVDLYFVGALCVSFVISSLKFAIGLELFEGIFYIYLMLSLARIFVSLRHWRTSKGIALSNMWLNFQICSATLAIGYIILALPGYSMVTFASVAGFPNFLIIIGIVLVLKSFFRKTNWKLYWAYLKFNVLKAVVGFIICVTLFYSFNMSKRMDPYPPYKTLWIP